MDYTARYGGKNGRGSYVGTELFTRDGEFPLPAGFTLTGTWSGLFFDKKGNGRASTLTLTEQPDGRIRGAWDGDSVSGLRTALGKASWELEMKKAKYRVVAEASHGGVVLNLHYEPVGGKGKGPEGWAVLVAPPDDKSAALPGHGTIEQKK